MGGGRAAARTCKWLHNATGELTSRKRKTGCAPHQVHGRQAQGGEGGPPRAPCHHLVLVGVAGSQVSLAQGRQPRQHHQFVGNGHLCRRQGGWTCVLACGRVVSCECAAARQASGNRPPSSWGMWTCGCNGRESAFGRVRDVSACGRKAGGPGQGNQLAGHGQWCVSMWTCV